MKKQLNDLYELVKSLCDLYQYDKRFLTISVVLQNICFISSNTKTKVCYEKYNKYLKVLKNFAKQRPDCHISGWVYDEARMIIEEAVCTQDYEEYYGEQSCH